MEEGAGFAEAKNLFERALLLIDDNQLPAAVELMTKANKLAPDRPSIVRNLGALNLGIGRFAEARRMLRRLAEIDDSFDPVEVPISLAFGASVLANRGQSHSQLYQDLLVDGLLRKENGFFVEFGATDGKSLSNSLYLERVRNWKGILAEPARRWQAALRKNRPHAILDGRCVWKTTGETLMFMDSAIGEYSTLSAYGAQDSNAAERMASFVEYEVETVALNDLCEAIPDGSELDYLSVDTEGTEFEILSGFDLSRFRPKIVTVEHNFTEQRDRLFRLFCDHGYARVLTSHSQFDDWFILREYFDDACLEKIAAKSAG